MDCTCRCAAIAALEEYVTRGFGTAVGITATDETFVSDPKDQGGCGGDEGGTWSIDGGPTPVPSSSTGLLSCRGVGKTSVAIVLVGSGFLSPPLLVAN